MKELNLMMVILILPFLSISQHSPVIPAKTNSSVNDYADVLSDGQENQLISYIKSVELKSSIQFCIVTTNGVDKGYPIEDFANDLFNQWGIGQNGLDNGCLILVLPNNRKSRVEVGYGLEKTLTDGYTRIKQSELLNPYFKQGDYYTGLKTLVEDFANKLNPEFQAQQQALITKQQKERKEALSTFFDYFIYIVGGLLIIAAIIILYMISAKSRRIKEEAEKARLLEIKRREDKILEDYRAMVKESKKLIAACLIEYEQHIRQISELSEVDFINSKEILINLQNLKSDVDGLGSLKETEVKSKYMALHEKFLELTKVLYLRKKQKIEAEFVCTRIQYFEKEHAQRLKNAIEIINNLKSYSPSIWKSGKKNGLFDLKNNFTFTVETLFEKAKIDRRKVLQLIENKEYEQAFELSTTATASLTQYDDLLKFVHNKLEEVNFCNNYLLTNKTKINDLINRISLKSADSMVSISTRRAFKDYYSTINQQIFFATSLNASHNDPIADKFKLETVLDTLKKHEDAIDLDIFNYKEEVRHKEEQRLKAIEDEKRRKQREQDEADDARRRRNSSSSSPSYGGGRSYGGGTSFGGGRSGGGGSNNSW